MKYFKVSTPSGVFTVEASSLADARDAAKAYTGDTSGIYIQAVLDSPEGKLIKASDYLKTTEAWKDYFRASSDIYYFFIIKSLNLIKENGYLSFIIPNYWLHNKFSDLLRELYPSPGDISTRAGIIKRAVTILMKSSMILFLLGITVVH